MMYKVFLKYPEALRPAFPRLKEKLVDPDPGNLNFFRCIFCLSYHKVSEFLQGYNQQLSM